MADAAPLVAPSRHSALEDVQGIAFGVIMVALGLAMLRHLGFVTGQTAGLALGVSLTTGAEFAVVFVAVNLPFLALALARLGPVFTAKTFAAVLLLSLLSWAAPSLIAFERLDPLAGAVLGGLTSGLGLLALFRHGCSLGGIGVLAVYLQGRYAFPAGWTQMIVDAGVFSLALAVLPLEAVGYSVLGAVVMNLVIAVNHRRDRYVGF